MGKNHHFLQLDNKKDSKKHIQKSNVVKNICKFYCPECYAFIDCNLDELTKDEQSGETYMICPECGGRILMY